MIEILLFIVILVAVTSYGPPEEDVKFEDIEKSNKSKV